MQNRLAKSLDNYDSTSDAVRNLVNNTNSKIERIGNTIEPFEDLATTIYDKVAQPVNQTLSIVNALTKALGVFKSRIQR